MTHISCSDALTFQATNLTPETTTGWHGHLELEFAAQDGMTQLLRSQAQAPLKFQRPFYPEGKAICHGVMLHTAGGIVGGDRLSINITLDQASHVLLTTAAATKLYRSTGNDSIQATSISIDDQACLEWFPQETILFNGAQYCQSTRIDLADRAIWVGWELTRLGRSARGETFQSGVWRSHTEVWRNNQPLWIDRQFVEGGKAMIHNQHGLADFPVVGSFALVGKSVSTDVMIRIRKTWSDYQELQAFKPRSTHKTIGVTRLHEGLLCRYRGASTLEARQLFMTAWDIVRHKILHQVTHRPRIWSI